MSITYHTWGDEDFDWDLLHAAEAYINREATKIGLMPLTKEKFGTIRYELIGLWNRQVSHQEVNGEIVTIVTEGRYPSARQLGKFNDILLKATQLFEEVELEIVDDWIDNFEEEDLPQWLQKMKEVIDKLEEE